MRRILTNDPRGPAHAPRMLNNPVQDLLIRMQQTSPRFLAHDLPLRAIVFLFCSISMTPVADAARLEEIIVTAARRPESALR